MLPETQNTQPESLKFNYKGATEPSLILSHRKILFKKTKTEANKNKTTHPNLSVSVYAAQ